MRPVVDPPVVCTLGDLVEDVVVRCGQRLVRGADVAAAVERHRGGSAANTAAAVVRSGGHARFLGRVGDDAVGDRLLADLTALGVDCPVPRRGRTGTVVVVVEPDGERTMCSDRRCAADLDTADPHWLDGVAFLHVPYYGLRTEPLASTARALLHAARARDVGVTLDPSSVTFLGDAGFVDLVREVQPFAVLCNEDEAAALGVGDHGLVGGRLVVVKQGPAPALLRGEAIAEVPARKLRAPLDTTGAGDAFAGGFLRALAAGEDPVTATAAGHDAAAHVVRGRGADAWVDDDAWVEGGIDGEGSRA